MKTAIIFGASGGIGYAIGEKFHDEGISVIAGVRKMKTDLNFADLVIEGDFASEAEVAQMVNENAEDIGQIDVWIYAAGDIGYQKINDLTSENWIRIFGANVFGAKNTLSACYPLLAEDAHVMFLGAYTDRLMIPGLSAYTASKSSLAAFSSIVEKELRGRKVSLIRPSAVDTPFWEKVPFKLPAGALSPQEVAEKVFLTYKQSLTGLVDL